MEKISIIFAYRNRETSRIRAAMDSLQKQSNKSFEVIFVNYGSDLVLSNSLKKLFTTYDFVDYYFLEVGQQLWNKSRALNFGIKKAGFTYIFIADVDIIFSPDAVKFLLTHRSPEKFCLFKMGYLNEKESAKLNAKFKFKELKPERYGQVNGMILTTKKSFFDVKGYDEFFHFYGSEDVDLYSRLEIAGYESILVADTYFYHNWHKSYQKYDKGKLSLTPRLTNVLRINEQHFFYNQRKKIAIPEKQSSWGETIVKSEVELLKTPTRKIKISNIYAELEHLFREELPYISKEIVEIRVLEDPYYHSLKYRIKKILGKQSQIYCSLKEANDIILKEVLFKYRNLNYSYEISNDLKSIIFKIHL
jgi:glycosyltransferase involved in cell wall biosynthesis